MKTSWRQTGTVTIRITKTPLTFLRGYFEGIALPELGRRYLSDHVDGTDLRILKSYLKSFREQLVMLARHGNHELRDLRLLFIDPEKLRIENKATSMTLDEFREIRDPYEVYGELELLAMYEEERGTHALRLRKVERNERLRRRQIQVLNRLEQLLAAEPQATDTVSRWLEPQLAHRLTCAGITTLGELVEKINTRGYRWWIDVPGIGEKAAWCIVEWLRTPFVGAALGKPIAAHALLKPSALDPAALLAARPKTCGIVPIECFCPPAGMEADRAAVLDWLHGKTRPASTLRAYRIEAERFLLFTTLELGKPFSHLTTDDLDRYRQFLALLAPGPLADWPFTIAAEHWIGPRDAERWTPRWRPFAGALSAASQRRALDVCQLLIKQLVSPARVPHTSK